MNEGGAATPRFRLPAAARLRTQQHFRRVYGRGVRAGGRLVTVVALRHKSGRGARLGVSVSKDHGTAVRRNKIKRMLREAFRLERGQWPAEFDVVLIPQKRDDKLLLEPLRAELRELMDRVVSGRAASNQRRRHPRGRQGQHGGRRAARKDAGSR